MPQCKAKSKQSGGRCKNSAVAGRNVCHIHGGKTPAGIALPQFKDGRYSKYLPNRLIERYKAGISDDQLLVLADEIALIDSRLADLLSRVDTGENGQLWANLLKAWEGFKEASATVDRLKYQLQIDILFDAARDDYLAWGEIHSLIDQRRRMVESERKRLTEIQQMITAKEAMTLIAAIQGIILENVTDKDTIRAISAAVNGLVAA